MPTIQVRDVPQDAYDETVKRAKASGQSLQQYMRSMLVSSAAKPSKAEALKTVETYLQKYGSGVTTDDILEAIDNGRR